MLLTLVAVAVLGLQDGPPPPPLPPMPGRPPPLADGLAYGGHLGLACDDILGDDGRWFNDHAHPMAAGRVTGLNLSSPDFASVLRVIDPQGRVVGEVAAGRGEEAVLAFTATGGPVEGVRPNVIYRLRVSTAQPGGTGRWRLEVAANGRTDMVFPGEAAPFPVRTGCHPMPPVNLQQPEG